MLSPPVAVSFRIPKEEDIITKEEKKVASSMFPGHLDISCQEPIVVSSSLPSSSAEEETNETEDEHDQSDENVSKQLELYDPFTNGPGEIEPIPHPIHNQPPFTGYLAPNAATGVLSSVGAFAVQCAICFKWRLIPSKEKYEEIREHILEVPFFCVTGREWRSNISCEDPADIAQDGSRLWAIDKPNIAVPPHGWQRHLRIRGERSTKFADIYYQAPSGKRLRSMIEIQKFLLAHPEYIRDGVDLSQFSFQTPKPLRQNYVDNHPARLTTSCDGNNRGMSRIFESSKVNPLAWARTDDSTELQLARQPSNPHVEAPAFETIDQVAKKKARKTPSQEPYSSIAADTVKVEKHATGKGKTNDMEKRDRRVWTKVEEDALLDALEDLVIQGMKLDNNTFRPGYQVMLEKALETKCPGCNLKGKPHIESRMKYLKNAYNIVGDMLVQTGFGWDDEKKCVTVDSDDIWEAYIKRDPNAKEWRGKPLPIYHRLVAIFGKDRANRKGVAAHPDMVRNVVHHAIDESSIDRDGKDTIVTSKLPKEQNIQSQDIKRNAADAWSIGLQT